MTSSPRSTTRLLLSLSFVLTLALPAVLIAQDEPSQSPPSAWNIDQEASVLAVITHKDGVAARLAHNHIVTAQDVDATLVFDPADPMSIEFHFTAPTMKLRIDDPADQQRWYPAIEKLGILDEAFSEVDADDRADIHETMTSRKQLDAGKHATLGARLASKPAIDGENFSVQLELEVKGQKVSRGVKGSFQLDGSKLIVEAAGEFNFTEFGIKPYSAMLGAVKNSDRFHVFLHLEASPTP